MSKIEPETWKRGTDIQQADGRGEGNNGEKKGQGLVTEHV